MTGSVNIGATNFAFEGRRLKNKIFQSRDLCLRTLDTNLSCAKASTEMRKENKKVLDKGISPDCEEQFGLILKGMKTASGEEQARLDKDFHILLMESSDNALLSIVMSAVMTVYREWIDMVLQKAGILERKTEDVKACIDEHYNIIEELIEV